MKKHHLLLCCILATLYTYGQNRYQVIINELMADPAPVLGLPNSEWIELKNTGTTSVNLAGWRLGDLTGISGPMPSFTLNPGNYVIVCTGSAVSSLSPFGPAIAVTSFPSLDNDGDRLFLRAANGTTIHAVAYQSSWYQNELKKEGGWTLEMIDPAQPCTGKENWTASTHASGGTPGTVNSVNGSTTAAGLMVTKVYAASPGQIVVLFNQPVDSINGSNTSHYTLNNNTITTAQTLPPLFNQVQLTLAQPLAEETVYTLTVTAVNTCSGHPMTTQEIKTGLPSVSDTGDIVINEILFHPRANGYDYIELYNKSKKIIDLAVLSLSNRNTAGNIDNIRLVSNEPRYSLPGEYMVLTENADNLALNYLVPHPDKVIVMNSLPSYPNTAGTVVLLNQQGHIIDEVGYNNKWHFPLIDNDEGIALERIDPDQPSQQPANWHSAASTAGFGTPTAQNSQHRLLAAANGTVSVSPSVFSPDGDGFNDITAVQYTLPEAGFVANITIFDATGRPVKTLVRNGTTSTSGYWNWNGLDDRNRPLPIGTYIIFSELFNLSGKKQVYKNTVVLARRL